MYPKHTSALLKHDHVLTKLSCASFKQCCVSSRFLLLFLILIMLIVGHHAEEEGYFWASFKERERGGA